MFNLLAGGVNNQLIAIGYISDFSHDIYLANDATLQNIDVEVCSADNCFRAIYWLPAEGDNNILSEIGLI